LTHDNPAETITGCDIDVALADIVTLTNHFTCQDCDRYVEASQATRSLDGCNDCDRTTKHCLLLWHLGHR
jgi:hypothetical protein